MIYESVAGFFKSIQPGIDIATFLAITGSAYSFIRSQKKAAAIEKEQKINASVRNVATEHLQEALQSLSRKYIYDIVNNLTFLQNYVKGDFEAIEARFTRDKSIAKKIIDKISEVNDGIHSFSEEVYTYRYQIYPLLDTLPGGGAEITEFKNELNELTKNIQTAKRGRVALLRELEALLDFCEKNPVEELSEKNYEDLVGLIKSIMVDEDYSHWVNTFIEEEKIEMYWKGGNSEEFKNLQAEVFQNIMAYAYKSPDRLRAQVFRRTYASYQDISTHCKKFLIMLASINYVLLRQDNELSSRESLSAIRERYSSVDYFNLDQEWR